MAKSAPLVGVLTLVSVVGPCLADEAISPGELVVEPPTLICLGFQWYAEGDDDRDATVAVEYRKVGERTWRTAMNLLRLLPSRDPNDVPPAFAGTIFDLEEGAEYECRLSLSDPDGGGETRTVKVATRAEARAAKGGKVRHVYPADHKGEIPKGAYYGLLAAFRDRPNRRGWGAGQGPARGVEPGMTFLVHAGTYKGDRYGYRDDYFLIGFGTYHIAGLQGTTEKPIVIKPAGDGPVVFDGAGCFRLFDLRTARHLVFEGFTVRNTEFAIWLGDFGESIWAEDVTIRNCTFEEVTHGVMGRHPKGRDYTIVDNRFIGRGPRGQNVEANIAVEVGGKGHVIAYNYCERFFDFTNGGANGEVTYSYMYEPGQDSAIDCYNNDLREIKDNALCTGGRSHNIRFFRNRILNQNGATLAPYGGNDSGPIYWVRNVTHGAGGFKFLRCGNLAYHNTCHSGLMGRIESNTETYNNLFLAEEARKDKQPLVLYRPPIWKSDLAIDHNAWFLPSSHPSEAVFAQVGDKTFLSLDAYRKAVEKFSRHDVMVTLDDVRAVPDDWASYGTAIEDIDALDLRPSDGSPLIDAAKLLPNINDDYAGDGPDIGALEAGKPLPHYGPRKK